MITVIEHAMESDARRTWGPHSWLTEDEYELFRPIIEPFEDTLQIKTGKEIADTEKLAADETDNPGLNVELLAALKEFGYVYMDPTLYSSVERLGVDMDGTPFVDVVSVGPNCLAFALRTPFNLDGSVLTHRPYPGYYAGMPHSERLMDAIECADVEIAKKEMSERIAEDVKAMGGELVEVDRDYKCAEGEWKICMMGSSEMVDFHYMREVNGVWFHKEGVMGVTCLDKNNKLIVDPERCETNYDQFYGYYVIRGVDRKGDGL